MSRWLAIVVAAAATHATTVSCRLAIVVAAAATTVSCRLAIVPLSGATHATTVSCHLADATTVSCHLATATTLSCHLANATTVSCRLANASTVTRRQFLSLVLLLLPLLLVSDPRSQEEAHQGTTEECRPAQASVSVLPWVHNQRHL